MKEANSCRKMETQGLRIQIEFPEDVSNDDRVRLMEAVHRTVKTWYKWR